jgi:hypothetical protein
MTVSATPQIGLGTILSIGVLTGGPTWTPIGGNTKIVPPKPKWGTEDVTTLNQTSIGRQFIKALLDQGEASGSGFWESADAGQIALQAAFLAPSDQANGANYPFKLVLPLNLAGGQATTPDTFTFSGLVTDFSVGDAEPGKSIPYEFTIKINGTPVPTYVEGV